MFSIRRFLLIGLLGALALSFALIFLFNRYQTSVEVNELYDTQLAQTSRILQGFLDRPTNEIDFDHLNNALLTVTNNYIGNDNLRSNEGHEYEHKFAIQIWDKESNLLVKSPAAPMYSMTSFNDGYSSAIINNYNWTIFSHRLASNGYWIMVAERADVREEMVSELTFSSLVGPIIGMIFLVLVVIVVITIGLKPLVYLSEQIHSRHIDKLEPLELQKSPVELKPLAQAVNLLMTRVSADVERERRFLGDIAHELRTPLTAIKLNAQSGLNAKEPQKLQHFLIKIVYGVDRSIRLIEQLLTLARLDPRALGEPEICNLGDIAQDVVSTLNSPHLRNPVENLELDVSLHTANVLAHPVLLGVLLRNLIENACRYTPEGSKMTLTAIAKDTGSLTIELCDQGPGVSELQLQSLGKRFFRERAADSMGNGLGLSIVARIAELHHAKVHFSNREPQGLKVSVAFPPTL